MSTPFQLVGHTLGHYHIVEQIGAGGMGVVYRAHDEQLERDVALKVLPVGSLADEAARRRFRKEALALAKLNHPNIATIFEFSSQEGTDYLVTEYISGVTLDVKLAAGTFADEEVVDMGIQLAQGLNAAHERGIVHRDLKPANLRLTSDERLKILDFGLAQLMPHPNNLDVTVTMTTSQEVTGTLPYMAPEQLRGERADARSDIWAAGAVLYEMATGHRPFEEKVPTALAADIIHKAPALPGSLRSELIPGLESVILKCLEKEPARRYQSAKELLFDLRRLQSPIAGTAPAAKNVLRRRRTLPVVAIALACVAAVLLSLNVARWRERLLGRSSPDKIRSLAVLPLDNLSHDPEQDYFADGMTEELITDLSKIAALRVISRTSVMRYKATNKPLSQIAKELNVDAVIEGSVLKAGNRVRITTQLIRVDTDMHLWAESYEGDLHDVLFLQSNVARAVADEIKIRLTPEEQAHLQSTQPVNPEAHEAYLKGRYHWNKRSPEGFKRAVIYFQQAIDKDPNYAPAYAGLADCYDLMGDYGVLPVSEAGPKARAAALKALELDSTLAEAHTALGFFDWHYQWDFPSAEKEFRLARQLNPGYATNYNYYSEYLAAMARLDESLAMIRKSQELDPLSLIINRNWARMLFFARRYDEAIEQADKVLEMDPNFVPIHALLADVYEEKRMYPEAISEHGKTLELLGEQGLAKSQERVYSSTGWSGVLRWRLDQAQNSAKNKHGFSVYVAAAYADLGDREKAISWLQRAYERHDYFLVFLQASPTWDILRSDSRFKELVRKVGLPPVFASNVEYHAPRAPR